MKELDKHKFKEVFKQYYNPLCNFASTIVHDRKKAQDVVQDVFTKLWAQKDSLSISSNEKSYLFQAVKNRALEVLRRDKTEKEVVAQSVLDTQNQIADLDSEAQKFMLREQLYSSIRQLPPKCQEIFVMNKIDGLTYREIAEKMGVSVKTVENHIGKAYRKLRVLMADRLPD